jgi:hypothetical protein
MLAIMVVSVGSNVSSFRSDVSILSMAGRIQKSGHPSQPLDLERLVPRRASQTLSPLDDQTYRAGAEHRLGLEINDFSAQNARRRLARP